MPEEESTTRKSTAIDVACWTGDVLIRLERTSITNDTRLVLMLMPAELTLQLRREEIDPLSE